MAKAQLKTEPKVEVSKEKKTQRKVGKNENIQHDGKFYTEGKSIWLTPEQEKRLDKYLVPLN